MTQVPQFTRRRAILTGLWIVAGSVFIIVFALAADATFLVWLLPVAIVGNVVFVIGRRHRLARYRRGGVLTGRVVTPIGPWRGCCVWTGGANVAGAIGRMNVTWPLAELSVEPGALTLRLRMEPLIVATFGARSVRVAPSPDLLVYPARGRLRSDAIGIELAGQAPAYFWSMGASREILGTISAAGFAVSWEERRAKQW